MPSYPPRSTARRRRGAWPGSDRVSHCISRQTHNARPPLPTSENGRHAYTHSCFSWADRRGCGESQVGSILRCFPRLGKPGCGMIRLRHIAIIPFSTSSKPSGPREKLSRFGLTGMEWRDNGWGVVVINISVIHTSLMLWRARRSRACRTLFRGWGVRFLLLSVVLVAWVFASPALLAQTTRTWTGADSSDWFDPGNWSPVGVPAATDTVNITNGAVALTSPVVFSGQFNWAGGALAGNGLTILNSGVFNIIGGASPSVLLIAITNAGIVNWLGGNVQVNATGNSAGGPITNQAHGVWNIRMRPEPDVHLRHCRGCVSERRDVGKNRNPRHHQHGTSHHKHRHSGRDEWDAEFQFGRRSWGKLTAAWARRWILTAGCSLLPAGILPAAEPARSNSPAPAPLPSAVPSPISPSAAGAWWEAIW